jgi:hypothetical protein
VRKAFVAGGSFECEQRTHVGDLEPAHRLVDSKNSSSGAFISLYGLLRNPNNATRARWVGVRRRRA